MEAAEVVGFNVSDANSLLLLLQGAGGESFGVPRQRAFSLVYGKTKTGGLAAGAEGSVYVYNATASGWTVSSESIPAWTIGSTIAADTDVLLFPLNGRWLALKVC